jgi:hypothetical protein
MLKDWLPDVVEHAADSFDWFPNLRPAHRFAVFSVGLTIVGLIAITVLWVTKEPLDARGHWAVGLLTGGGVLGTACSLWYAATHAE